MTDMYFTETGDIRVDANGDIAITDTSYRNLGQQAHIRAMTQVGDWLTYPRLGADLDRLYGMPQSEATGNFGKALIESALSRESTFAALNYTVNAVPTGPQSIRFDITIRTQTGNRTVLSIERNLRMEED